MRYIGSCLPFFLLGLSCQAVGLMESRSYPQREVFPSQVIAGWRHLSFDTRVQSSDTEDLSKKADVAGMMLALEVPLAPTWATTLTCTNSTRYQYIQQDLDAAIAYSSMGVDLVYTMRHHWFPNTTLSGRLASEMFHFDDVGFANSLTAFESYWNALALGYGASLQFDYANNLGLQVGVKMLHPQGLEVQQGSFTGPYLHSIRTWHLALSVYLV